MDFFNFNNGQLNDFQSQGHSLSLPIATSVVSGAFFDDGTFDFSVFDFGGLGTATPPIGSGEFQFLIAGPDITEQFVTHGGISAMGVSYLINPLSRRTV